VFVGADRIGEEAANSFLKTLEEPPARCIFLLLTDTPQAILPTILSRCQRLLLSSESELLPDPWRGVLIEILGRPMGAGLMGRLTRASQLEKMLSDIKKMVEKDEKKRYQEEQEVLRNPDDKVKATKAKDAVLEARVEARFRGLRAMVLRAMLFWYRDLLVTVCGTPSSQLRYPEQAALLAGIAKGLSFADALGNIRVVEAMQRQFDRNLPTGLVVAEAANGLTA
jgi:DNA polymerase-3 subunit delta'